ncbi:hypothetical protein FACS1894186_4510 [Alphaproteobacteria bacterium]|nr:hypothetical protein FACS1894186_4510 [Alphaproteobacteria bacterium]
MKVKFPTVEGFLAAARSPWAMAAAAWLLLRLAGDRLAAQALEAAGDAPVIVFFRVLDKTDPGLLWLAVSGGLMVFLYAYAGISIAYERYAAYLHRARSLAFVFTGLAITAIAAGLASPVAAADTAIVAALAKLLLYVYPRYDIFYLTVAASTVSAQVFSGHYPPSAAFLSVFAAVAFIRRWRALWERAGDSVQVKTRRERGLS